MHQLYQETINHLPLVTSSRMYQCLDTLSRPHHSVCNMSEHACVFVIPLWGYCLGLFRQHIGRKYSQCQCQRCPSFCWLNQLNELLQFSMWTINPFVFLWFWSRFTTRTLFSTGSSSRWNGAGGWPGNWMFHFAHTVVYYHWRKYFENLFIFMEKC